METIELISYLQNKGVAFNVVGDKLRINSPQDIITTELHQLIKGKKDEIILLINTFKQKDNYKIKMVEKKEYYPLSSAQKRLYFLYEFDKYSLAYNSPHVSRLKGKLDKRRFNEVFKMLISRHESFRTTFHIVFGEPMQKIAKQVNFEFEHFKAAEAEVNSIIKKFIRPFKFNEGNLIRVGLIEIFPEEHVLILDMHHIITDGISKSIIIKDFMSLYNNELLKDINIHYKDYIKWQHELQKTKNNKQKDFWLGEFSEELNKLELPIDFPRAGVKNYEGGSVGFEIAPFESSKLKDVSNSSKCTMFMVVLSIFNILLSKLSSQEDIIIGVPVANREHSDLEVVVGLFLNTLPLRNYPVASLTFKEFLLELKINTLACFDNQSYQYEDLINELRIERNTNRNPLFDVGFAFQNFEESELVVSELTLSQYNSGHSVSKFDISLIARQHDEKMLLNFEYSTELFKKETIERFIEYFKKIVNTIINDVNIRISDIEIISENEKNQLLQELNFTRTDYPKDKTVIDLFLTQRNKTPDRIAIKYYNNSITYRELDNKSTVLAQLLRNKGVKPNKVIGILMDRSIETIISMLSIMKAGGAYLPLDIEYPEDRLNFMLNNSETEFIVTNKDIINNSSFVKLKRLDGSACEIYKTGKRSPISELDQLPMVNRSSVNYEKYNQYIGQAMVRHGFAMQATRGCPYKCLYCHKIWPKGHKVRSAQNIYNEVKLNYDLGVRRFIFIDDIFNLNKENSTQFFDLVIDNGLKIQIFFPNGLRGDILTEEYIDLMVKAGTVNIAMALESASPRIQKLIKKNINIPKLKENIEYIAKKYPHVVLELFTMLGFPTESKEEALMTLDFVKSVKWIHFPYVHILKIYPNTEMANFALESGISLSALNSSKGYAFHELPETLPFEKSFVKEFQTEFLSEYFLNKERLKSVLASQLIYLTKDEIVEKYKSYLGINVITFKELLSYLGFESSEFTGFESLDSNAFLVPDLNIKIAHSFKSHKPLQNTIKILLLDLSQDFSQSQNILNNLIEPPLGLMYLTSYLQNKLGEVIDAKILKSRIDFDSFNELKVIIDEFCPDVIGIRTLTYYQEFFHLTVHHIREWGVEVPLITGGPYATSDYITILKDKNIDLVVLGEGEITFCEIIEKIIQNGKKLPEIDELKKIPGIAFFNDKNYKKRDIIFYDSNSYLLNNKIEKEFIVSTQPSDICYIIYTSGTTGNPKGVLVEHKNVVRLFYNDEFQFDFNSSDVWTMFHSHCFDFSVWEIYGALLFGGRFIIIPRINCMDTVEYLKILKKEQVTILNQTPSAFYNLIQEELLNSDTKLNLKYVVFGGESLNCLKLKSWRTKYPNIKLINMFGITETTVHVTYKEIGEYEIDNNISNIGKPIPTTSVYIFDKNQKLVPKGVIGELYVGGFGVSRGYIGNEELTNQRFIPNPYNLNERLYRSGDLASILDNGDIKYIGRIDNQIQLRGFRIELGEIESVLNKIETTKDCIVDSKIDTDGNIRLVAYIVSDNKLNIQEIRECLSKSLPDYMIPPLYVRLDSIPLTPNGKIDKKALPNPEGNIEKTNQYVAPQTDIEKKLASIWQEILSIEKVGIYDNFFELGGHSLNGMVTVMKINEAFNLSIQIKVIFQHNTILSLAKYLTDQLIQTDNKQQTQVIKPDNDTISGEVPLSLNQYWFLRDVSDGLRKYPHQRNIGILAKCKVKLGTDVLKKALKYIMNYHDALRARFIYEDDDWIQLIDEPVNDVPFEYIDLSGLKEEKHVSVTENSIKELQDKLNLSNGPLLYMALFHYGKSRSDHIILFFHHQLIDGFSHTILMRDFLIAITQIINKKEVKLPDKTVSFKQYNNQLIKYTNENFKKREFDFWKNLPWDKVPYLPIDYANSRENMLFSSLKTHNFSLNKEVSQFLLQEIPKRYNKPVVNALLMALCESVTSWTKGEYMEIINVINGRDLIPDIKCDLSNSVGYFATSGKFVLKKCPSNNPNEQMKSMNKQLDQFPNHGVGFGLLHAYSEFIGIHTKNTYKRGTLPRFSKDELVFNYLGDMGIDESDESANLFEHPDEFKMHWKNPNDNNGKILIMVNTYLSNGIFSFSIEYFDNIHKYHTIEKLGNRFVDTLLDLQKCLEQQNT